MSPIDVVVPRTHIAYFTMETAIRPEIHSYSSGLLYGMNEKTITRDMTLISNARIRRRTLGLEGSEGERC